MFIITVINISNNIGNNNGSDSNGDGVDNNNNVLYICLMFLIFKAIIASLDILI